MSENMIDSVDNTVLAAQPLPGSQHITSLATAGILICIEMSAWTGSKQDRGISDEVATAKKASTEAGRYVKHLMAGDLTHKRLINHRQTVYNFIRKFCFPWSGDWWYLPQPRIGQFMTEYRTLEQYYVSLRGEFVTKYQSIVSNAAFTQGDMFRREDYPSVKQVERKFKMLLNTSEVPSNDYRVQIADDLAADLHATYNRQAKEFVDRMVSMQCKQLVSVMESLSHCCENETTERDGEIKVRRRKIYDTTITKAVEYCNTFKQFNLTDNPDLALAVQSLNKLLDDVPLVALKDSDSLRARVKSEVDEILSKFRPTIAVDDIDDEDDE